MRWVVWLLAGLGLFLAIILGACLIGAARLNPWLARRLARGPLASAMLLLLCDAAVAILLPHRD
jgi:hypothetical protein